MDLKKERERISVWETPPVEDLPFSFTIENYEGSETDIYNRSIEARKMCHKQKSFNQGWTFMAEWGYSFTHLDGQIDGSGRKIKAGYSTLPASRKEALAVIHDFTRSYTRDKPHPWVSMNGHYPWHHYAGEFGFDILCSEIGENINNYQWHIALNRGAAKQYRAPWSIDFSAWHGPSITDYSKNKFWKEYSSPDGGHSMSLLERTYYMAYMSGTNELVAEGGAAISFYDETDEDGLLKLSPYGQIGKEVYEFSEKIGDRGICYTPFALVVDYYHGMYSGFDGKSAFYYEPYNKGDEMTWQIVDRFFPGGWEVQGRAEAGTMVNGPYGDTMDVFLQNVPAKVLETYPCVILSGDIHFNEEDISKFCDYVKQGGTLILNRAYLTSFPEFSSEADSFTYGEGKVLLFGSDYSLDGFDEIIQAQLKQLIPLEITGRPEYIINICEDRLLLTLINNNGVTKEPMDPPVIDLDQAITVTVRYTDPGAVTAMTDIKNDIVYSAADNTVRLTLQPGEVKILEIKPHTK